MKNNFEYMLGFVTYIFFLLVLVFWLLNCLFKSKNSPHDIPPCYIFHKVGNIHLLLIFARPHFEGSFQKSLSKSL